ncbi:pyridoxal kinase [Sphingopyxis sp. KK2]|uniref:pyridoxal kinase n=1 Tax=Sphingopyxis sp. KK2 TaxID=1855727 RepID=UPI00097E6097|nr:pyridoxal kinase [Sphingopyxis sp. KK2]
MIAPLPRIISIQSQVIFGHVGNSAAVPVMTALGAAVTAVPTTLLSNHPHYPTMRGTILDAGLLADLLTGAEERGLVDDAAIIVTGFLGSVENGEVVADFIERAKRRSSRMRYICDPVLGDDDLGSFAAPGLLSLFREKLLPQAWLATPNRWEAWQLSGSTTDDAELLAAIAALGPENIIVTGGTAAADSISIDICEAGKRWQISTPRLPTRPAGTGDLFTGAVAARIAAGASVRDAARDATGIIFSLLARTGEAPWSEMPVEAELALAIREPADFAVRSIGGEE